MGLVLEARARRWRRRLHIIGRLHIGLLQSRANVVCMPRNLSDISAIFDHVLGLFPLGCRSGTASTPLLEHPSSSG